MDTSIVVEALALLIAAAVIVYAAARGVHVRRLAAQFYYRPKRDPVPLASLLREVFPDAQLPLRDREQLHRFGIDGGGPPWTEWIHRQNLSKISIISKSGESGWTGALTLHRIYETDGHVAEALSHLVHRRIEAFADLRKAPHWRSSEARGKSDPREIDKLYAEHIVTDSLKGRAHTAAFTEDPRSGAHQVVVDGRKFDITAPLAFDFQSHFEESPGTSMLTQEDFFRAGEGLFTIDHAPGSYKFSILGGAGLDAAFGTDKAHAGEIASAAPHVPLLASTGDVDFQNPFLTLGLSTLREIRLLKKKHTNLLTSVKNIGLDAAGTGIGSFAGAKAGATIGTVVAPGTGSVVGAIIGGISGAFAGRSISNRIKFSQAEGARSHYESKMLEFQQRVQEVTREAMNALDTLIAREQSVLANIGLKRMRELDALTQRLESGRRSAFVFPAQSVREFFSLCETDIRNEAKEIDAALGKVPFRESVLWPGDSAVRLLVQKKHVSGHLAELIRARSGILDPACSLGDVEKTEICLELFAAFGGHDEAILKHLRSYKTAALGDLGTLIGWPTAHLRELVRIRSSALRRIGAKAEVLRRKTGEELKKDVSKARRAQNRFAKELRKLGLVK